VNRAQQGLAQRRQELVQRSATQRSALIHGVEPLMRKAAALDRLVTSMRRHPLVTGLLAGAVALVGARKLFDMTTRLLTLYMLFRRR
jgi:hypothetical protein